MKPVATKRAAYAHERVLDVPMGSLGLVYENLPEGDPGTVDYLVICRTADGCKVFVMQPDLTPKKSGRGNTPQNALWMIA